MISLRIFCIRLMIVAFWLATIFAFLQTPRMVDALTEKKSLNLCIWPMILDPHVLTEFEQETGIKVYLTYYETNEELYSKLQATDGKGYDLIVPTDYAVELLIKNNLLKKMDSSQLLFKETLKRELLGHYFDPHNEYSIPYYMTVFGLGINKNFFNGVVPDASWNLVFNDQHVKVPLCMLDSMRESIVLASYYAYGIVTKTPSPEHIQKITQLLIDQKRWVEVYTSARIEELLASGSCPIGVGSNPDIWKASREYSHIEFKLPQEGSFWTIDSFVMPKATTKDAMVYQLLNFLYRKKVLAHNCIRYGFCPPTQNVSVEHTNIFCPSQEQYTQLHFFTTPLTQEQMHAIWLAVKAH